MSESACLRDSSYSAPEWQQSASSSARLPAKMLFDRGEDASHAPGAGVFLAGVVIGEPGLAGFRIAIAVSAKVEDQQIVLIGIVEQIRRIPVRCVTSWPPHLASR